MLNVYGKSFEKNKMLKSMIIGCGRIAGENYDLKDGISHASGYVNNNVELSVCIDIIDGKAKKFSEQYGCAIEYSIEDGLSKHNPDIVSICTPDETHFSISKEILQSAHLPKVIFLEKPACSNTKEYYELLELSKINGVNIVVNYTRRFDEYHIQLRNRIHEGEYGEFYRGFATYYSGWQHNGVHLIDTLSFLLKDTFIINRIFSVLPSPYKSDPTLELELKAIKSKKMITVLGVDESYYQIFDFSLLFAESRLRIEDFGEKIIIEKKIVNNIKENVLEEINNGLLPRKFSSMQNAIRIISKAITNSDYTLLQGFTLLDIYNTMQTIWSAEYEI